MDIQLSSREPGLLKARVYRVPDTLTNWPWPARISPHIDKVNADLNVSIKGYPQFEGKMLKVIEQGETAFIACYVYPTLNQAQLGVVTTFITIVWFVEEAVECAEDINDVLAISDVVMDALRHPFKTQMADEHILGVFSRQWWHRVIMEMTPISVQRLFHHIEEWLLSSVQQAKVFCSSEKETLEEYIEGRSIDVGMSVYMMFVEMEVDIPQDVWEHPTLATVRSLMCHMVSLDNDMFSYNREQALGDHHNILHILMRDEHLSLEGALKWAEERHHDLQDKYLQTLASMPSWGAEIDAQVDKYIGGLGRMISGNVKYCTLCKRYADGRKRIGPQDNRVFKLLPSRSKAITGVVE